MTDRHPATEAILKHFAFAPLPDHLGQVSRVFHDAAHAIVGALPDGPELTAGLRKLLEAKDCAVRAAVDANFEIRIAELPAPAKPRVMVGCPICGQRFAEEITGDMYGMISLIDTGCVELTAVGEYGQHMFKAHGSSVVLHEKRLAQIDALTEQAARLRERLADNAR